jgi:hypothetical protein
MRDSLNGTAFVTRTMQRIQEAFGCDSVCNVLRRRNFSAELHRLARNFLAASSQRKRDERCGENDGALHSLDLLCCPPAPPDLQRDLLGSRNIRAELQWRSQYFSATCAQRSSRNDRRGPDRTLHSLHGLFSITLCGSRR